MSQRQKCGTPAQPKGADFDKAETSADALALIGMFYNKMTRAGSYRGRLVMVTTIVEKGRFISKRTTEGESSWIADKEIQGAIKKDVSDFCLHHHVQPQNDD
jgi:hypothetical protein